MASLVRIAILASGVAALGAGEPGISDFVTPILAAHNAERVVTGAPPLAWDPLLAAGALAYAQQMAAAGNFNHSDRKARPGLGENIWRGTHGAYRPEAMIALWAGEKRYFLPGIFPANSRTGNWMDVAHYTQIIWPATARIGCGLATGRGTDYLVCRYSPKGNVDGRPVPAPPSERG